MATRMATMQSTAERVGSILADNRGMELMTVLINRNFSQQAKDLTWGLINSVALQRRVYTITKEGAAKTAANRLKEIAPADLEVLYSAAGAMLGLN